MAQDVMGTKHALFQDHGERKTARYVSNLMVREEALEDGMLHGLYWSSSGQIDRWVQPYDYLKHSPSTAFELEIDGRDLSAHWQWKNAFLRDGERGTLEAVIELTHQTHPVDLSVVTVLDGSQIFSRYLQITNTGTAAQALSRVSPLSGLIWNTAMDLGRVRGDIVRSHRSTQTQDGFDMTRFSLAYLDSNFQGQEGDLVWRPLTSQAFKIERTHGHAYAAPYWIVRNEVTGEFSLIALAWSGNYLAEFSCHENLLHDDYHLMEYQYPCLSFRVGPTGIAPMRIIDPGETIRTPGVHVGMFHDTLDAAVAGWHAHLRASVIPKRPAGKEPFVAAGRVVEQPGEWILREADIAAEMGVEGFMMDAGWYGSEFASWWKSRGDWQEGDWLPGGVAGVRDYVHGKGMLFGLWHEAEGVTADSDLSRKHPEWMARPRGGKAVENLNLADPAAAKFMEDTIDHLVGGYALDYYKLDHNTMNSDRAENPVEGGHEYEAWRHNEVLYRAYDRILEKYPSVLLENCAGGGGRNDLGILSRFHYACESDFSYFPNNIRAINTMTLFLPPEALCYYHNHIGFAHTTCDAQTHLRAALFCMPIFVGFGAQDSDRSTEFFRITKRYIELFKRHCKPVLARSPRVYHHTPSIGLFRPSPWCVLEYALDDGSMGYAGIFKVGNENQNDGGLEYVFRPRGLLVSADYDVYFDSLQETVRMSGRELALRGIPVRLESAMSSEFLVFMRAD